MQPNKLMTRLALLALIMATIVVVLGAFTRLVDAGLGCPDWPTCYGHVWVPNEAHEIEAANQLFEQTPVEAHKTWPEQIHRIFASTLGLVILGIFGIAYNARKNSQPLRSVLILLVVLVSGVVARVIIGDILDPYLWVLIGLYFGNLARIKAPAIKEKQPFLLPALLAGLVIVQGFFGMWTVTLKLWPQVVTAHLLGGFATLSLIWLLLQRSGGWRWSLQAPQVIKLMALQKLALLTLVLVVCQIALGGWTSSNYAALACPDFPTCQNMYLPQADYAQGFNIFQQVGPNYLGGLMDNNARTAIHLIHRFGAIVVTLVTLLLTFRLWQIKTKLASRMAIAVTGIVVTQVALGISNIVFALPLAIAVLHNAGGALFLLAMVTLNHRIRTVKTL